MLIYRFSDYLLFILVLLFVVNFGVVMLIYRFSVYLLFMLVLLFVVLPSALAHPLARTFSLQRYNKNCTYANFRKLFCKNRVKTLYFIRQKGCSCLHEGISYGG